MPGCVLKGCVSRRFATPLYPHSRLTFWHARRVDIGCPSQSSSGSWETAVRERAGGREDIAVQPAGTVWWGWGLVMMSFNCSFRSKNETAGRLCFKEREIFIRHDTFDNIRHQTSRTCFNVRTQAGFHIRNIAPNISLHLPPSLP